MSNIERREEEHSGDE
jgi:tetratricopeptide (TPR) repeat protein